MSFRLFEPDTRLLPALCKPYSDELLTSWLTRLAHNHGMGLRQLYTYIWPDYNLKSDIDRCINDDQINSLAIATNCTDEQVKETTLSYYQDRLFDNYEAPRNPISWATPGTRHRQSDEESYYSTGLMFCPACLIKDGTNPYFRKHWRLATSFVCNECGCYLQECCPHCHHGNSFLNIKSGYPDNKSLVETMLVCHTCGMNITDMPLTYAPWSVRQLQLKLNEIIENGILWPTTDAGSYFRVLFYLSSTFLAKTYKTSAHQRFAELVMTENGLEPNDIYSKEAFFVRYVDAQTRSIVIGLAYWLLDQWPHRISRICKETRMPLKDLCSLIRKAPSWFVTSIATLLKGIQYPETNEQLTGKRKYVDVADNELGHWNIPVVDSNELAVNTLIYDIDFDEKYNSGCVIEIRTYEYIQSQCHRFCDHYPDEDTDIVSELCLKPFP